MPTLDWSRFEALGEAPTASWESLCREAVRRTYGHLGVLKSLSQQPGVEFHLKLEQDSQALGSPGRWWGWQCRWYDLAAGRALGTTRRAKIKKALEKSRDELPELTDWVLWTRRTLTKADQKWFYALGTGIRLHLWTQAEIDGLLSGEALALRKTYFGEHAFSPPQLQALRLESIEPVAGRWDPALAVQSDAERRVRRHLGEPGAWARLEQLALRLGASAAFLERAVGDLDPGSALAEDTQELLAEAITIGAATDAVARQLSKGDVIRARQSLEQIASMPDRPLDRRRMLARLRSARSEAALAAQQVWADRREASLLVSTAIEQLGARLVAILAGAGEGKSFLAAEISAPADHRPAGFFLQARPLKNRGSLDELAAAIPSAGFANWTELLETAEAAGARSGTRVPIVLDGLNESQNPHDWHDLLATTSKQLERFDHVLVIVTLRPSVAEMALPKDVPRIELDAFAGSFQEAVAIYFDHYLINAAGMAIPRWLLTSPLVLRLFCEAANHDRLQPVEAADLPLSLAAVFDSYRQEAIDRAARDSDRLPADLNRALLKAAGMLWDESATSLPFEKLSTLFADDPKDWAQSPVRALEEQGVLMRDPVPGGEAQVSSLLFDQFAGHLVADAIVQRLGSEQIRTWLAAPETIERLDGPGELAHPLWEDIFEALVSLLPARYGGLQLWTLVEGNMKARALVMASELEPRLIDAETRNALLDLIREQPLPKAIGDAARGTVAALFQRVFEVIAVPGHPLGANFLDQALRSMPVWERDLRWSEWLRQTSRNSFGEYGPSDDIRELTSEWTERQALAEYDRAQAQWLAWALSVTDRALRHRAGKALALYGLADPVGIFQLTTSLLDVDDPQISAEILTLAYGVCLNRQLPDAAFEEALTAYLERLAVAVLGDHASAATWHELSRDAIRGTFAFAARFFPAAVPTDIDPLDLRFAEAPEWGEIPEGDPNYDECEETFGMDFSNYTVGSEIIGRHNYETDNVAFKEALAVIRGRVWDLGWRAERFSEIDSRLGEISHRRDNNPNKVERYGKKYGMVAFFEWLGRAKSRGMAQRDGRDARHSESHLDPGFPASPPPLPLALETWARPTPADDRRWLRSGLIKTPDELLALEAGPEQLSRMLLIQGYLSCEDPVTNRYVFGLLDGLLVARAQVDNLREALTQKPYPGNEWIPRAYELHYTFAAEMAWRPAAMTEGSYFAEEEPRSIAIDDGMSIPVEVLAEEYAREGYHSVLNIAGGFPVPSLAACSNLDLRAEAMSLDRMEADASTATVTYAAPDGFKGKLMYMREDLLRQYAGPERELLWVLWGERQIHRFGTDPPKWMRNARSSHADIWRLVRTLDDLAPA